MRSRVGITVHVARARPYEGGESGGADGADGADGAWWCGARCTGWCEWWRRGAGEGVGGEVQPTRCPIVTGGAEGWGLGGRAGEPRGWEGERVVRGAGEQRGWDREWASRGVGRGSGWSGEERTRWDGEQHGELN